jgi:hypothetical protein
MTRPPLKAAGAQASMLTAALDYARCGWHVFPIKPGTRASHKSKRFSGGRNWGATANTAEIKKDWGRWPKANLGVATGADSGIFVMDIDTMEGHGVDGLTSLAALEKEHGALPPTLQGRTPSGGRHYVFKHPGNNIKIKNSASEVARGVDIRGDGGMFLAPPSAKADGGAYAWINDEAIADAPQWLLDRIVEHPYVAPAKVPLVPDHDPEFEREIRVRSGMGVDPTWVYEPASREELQAALDVIPSDSEQIWFKVGCALYRELGDTGLDMYLRWSAKSSKFNAAECREKWKHCAAYTGNTAGSIYFLADEHNPDWRQAIEDPEPEPEPEPEPKPEPNPKRDAVNRALSVQEWLARKLPPRDYLLGNVITSTSRMLLWAPTGIGKTMLAIALGMAMGHGNGFVHWNGVRPVRVLYVDGEMPRELLQERLRDEAERLGVEPDNVFLLSKEDCTGMTPLNTRAGQLFIDARIKELGCVDFIIFDNIMALIAGDQKDEECWRQTLPWVLSLTRRKIGQLWIHHTGHDETHGYGSKTREWQMDTVVQLQSVERRDTDVSFLLRFNKARQRKPSNRAQFEDVRIALVDDQWIYQRASGQSKEKLSPMAKKCLECLQKVLRSVDLVDKSSLPKDVDVVGLLEDWRAECRKLGLLGEKSNAIRAAFSKYRRELICKNWVACNETMAWVLP